MYACVYSCVPLYKTYHTNNWINYHNAKSYRWNTATCLFIKCDELLDIVVRTLRNCRKQWGPGHTEKPPQALVKFKEWK